MHRSAIAMIAFTGSTANGRKVGALAGEHLKRVSLELGGKNSIIILDDADLDVAASNARFGAWLHQGQICMTAGRILVHEKVASAMVEKFAGVANASAGGRSGEPESRAGSGHQRGAIAAGAWNRAGQRGGRRAAESRAALTKDCFTGRRYWMP